MRFMQSVILSQTIKSRKVIRYCNSHFLLCFVSLNLCLFDCYCCCFFSSLITLFIIKVVPFIYFAYMYSTDPAIFCDECLRITVWCTWFIYGLSL